MSGHWFKNLRVAKIVGGSWRTWEKEKWTSQRYYWENQEENGGL